ncbi:MAG: hypothetical protein K6G80_10040 [Treponema sp.]|nr:hypothetical protein [Treponema sp.]
MNEYTERMADAEQMEQWACDWARSYNKTGYAPYRAPALRLYTRAQAKRMSARELPLWRVL